MTDNVMADRLVVLDVGARGGPDPRWLPYADRVEVVGIEPDPEECSRLNAQRFPVPCRYLQAALGRADGIEETLRLTRQPGCSSLLEPNHPYLSQFPYGVAFEVERTLPLTVVSFDTLAARHAVRPDVIKIDTQGYELEILRGAEQALASTLLIEVEVEFNPLYKDQPLFGDIDAFLRQRGFLLLGIKRSAWRRNQEGSSAGGTLVHGDALYYRDPVPPPGPARDRFITALLAYRQHDFVRSLGGQVPAEPRSWLQQSVGRLAAAWRPHRLLRGWVDDSRPDGAGDWHDAEFF